MFRRFLTLLLLVPLSLNGMWMMCSEAAASEPATPGTVAPEQAEAAATQECQGNVMCPLHKPTAKSATPAAADSSDGSDAVVAASTQTERTGAICLLASDGRGASIAAIGFVYAPPTATLAIEAAEAITSASTDFRSIEYADAQLASATPPPKA